LKLKINEFLNEKIYEVVYDIKCIELVLGCTLLTTSHQEMAKMTESDLINLNYGNTKVNINYDLQIVNVDEIANWLR